MENSLSAESGCQNRRQGGHADFAGGTQIANFDFGIFLLGYDLV